MSRSSTAELSYFDIHALNNSALKTFHQKGYQAFYKEFVLGEVSKSKEDLQEKDAIIIGSVFDFIRTDCNGNLEEFERKYEEKFTLFDGVKSKTQTFLLADELFKITKRVGLTIPFEVRFREAVETLQAEEKFKGKSLENVLELFMAEPKEKDLEKNPNATSAQYYFESKLENLNKQTVDMYHLDIARRLLNQSNSDVWVKDVFKTDLEVKNKFVIIWEWDGIQCKSELDITLWDPINKLVYPKDLKTIYANTPEQIRYKYRKLLYGWQGVFYTKALRYYLDNNGMKDWKIMDFEFIFFSTGFYSRPARLEMTKEMRLEAINGRDFEGTHYPGLEEVFQEAKWHMDNSVWDCTKHQFLNNGLITI